MDFRKGGGLVPVVAQDILSNKVLMVAYANKEALQNTLKTGFAHYFSRSRGRLWRKGEESGHFQYVKQVLLDCDDDTLVYKIDQVGPACHTGMETCFFTKVEKMTGAEYDKSMIKKVISLIEEGAVVRRPPVEGSRRSSEYLVSAVTEATPPPPLDVYQWIVSAVDRLAAMGGKVLVVDGPGVAYGALLAAVRKTSLAIALKNPPKSSAGRFASVPYSSALEKGRYHVYGLEKGDHVLFFITLLSDGDEVIPLLGALARKGVTVDFICLAELTNRAAAATVKAGTRLAVKTLFRATIRGGKVKAEPTRVLAGLSAN